MTRKEFISLCLFVGVIIFCVVRFATAEYEYVGSRYLNYTPDLQGKNLRTEIYVISKKKNVQEIVENSFAEMQELVYKFSEEYDQSLIYKINNSTKREFEMDSDLYNLLVMADSMYRLTDGKFDVTLNPVYDLWDFDSVEDPISGDNEQFLPDSLEVIKKLEYVGFSKLSYDKEKLYLPEGMELNFGSISKGYIVDKIVKSLKEQGVIAGVIDQVSSIRYFGEIEKKLILGVQHPRLQDQTIEVLTNLENRSISTSGDYQQFFDIGSTRYHHIIDATTGYPARENVSVTLISTSAFEADAYSTALFLMNADAGIEFLKNKKDSDTIIYREKFNYNSNSFDAECLKTGKTEYSNGIDFYLND